MNQPDKPGVDCRKSAPKAYDMDDLTSLDQALETAYGKGYIPTNDTGNLADLIKRYRLKYEINITREPLQSGIAFLNADLRLLYLKTDAEALEFQRKHRNIAVGAILLGFVAIVFAIVQFCLLSLSINKTIPFINMDMVGFFRWGECIAVLFAAGAVVAGLYRSHQNRWLINRHIAERCRLLKFRSLLDNAFWNDQENRNWKEQVGREIHKLNEVYDKEVRLFTVRNAGTNFRTWLHTIYSRETEGSNLIEQWIKDEKIPASPVSGTCTCSHEAKVEFLDYYRKKRLIYQRDYYYCAYMRFKKTHVKTQKIPHLLFFASVCAVLAHFILDLISNGSYSHAVSVALIALAVTLPIAGYVVKTHRDTFQVARSSALYHAKYYALDNLNNRLSGYENSIDQNWKQILGTFWECENFLEAEHREWLILVHDAEWFL